MDSNTYVDGKILVSLFKEYIDANKKNCTRYLICGFPKTEENSSSWKEIIGDEYKVEALIYISYTRKEYEVELRERQEVDGKRPSHAEIVDRFNYFIKNTNLVFDDFGKKFVKISAKISDKMICDTILNHKIISKNFPKIE